MTEKSCPPCTGNCNQGRCCDADRGEPVTAWPFVVISLACSLGLVAVGYVIALVVGP